MNKKLSKLLERSENLRCADCNDVRPTWAVLVQPPDMAPPGSPILGLLCCLHCSAAHRRLENPSYTVKSVKLDQWDDDEILAMQQGGNLRLNAIFEGTMFDDTTKPSPLVDAIVRERFIHSKYTVLEYFSPNAYLCVGSEHEEDEDDEILNDDNTISLFSGSTASFCTSTLSSLSDAPCRLSPFVMPSVDENLPSLNRMSMMHRQYSLPAIKFSSTSADPCLTPRAIKVSDNLALKKIASPFRSKKDFWENMNNSTWGDMTFEDSLHRRSTEDLQDQDRRSSWGLNSNHSMPTICSDSECSEPSVKILRGNRDCRRRFMPKKAVSERLISKSSKGLMRRPPHNLTGENKAKEMDWPLLKSRPKSFRNVQPENPKTTEVRREGLASELRKDENSAQSPSKSSKPKAFSILDLLEVENRGRKSLGTAAQKPGRNRSDILKAKSHHLPRRQSSEPMVQKSRSLRDINHNTKSPLRLRIKSQRISVKIIDHSGEVKIDGKSRSLSPKSYRNERRLRAEHARTSSRNGRQIRSNNRAPEILADHENPTDPGQSDSRNSLHLSDIQRIGPGNQNESSSNGSNGRSSSEHSKSGRPRRRISTGHLQQDPPPPPSDTPKSVPSRRKASKTCQCQSSMGDNLCFPHSAPKASRLARSLSHSILARQSSKKGRPRSLDTSRRNRLKQARPKEIVNEGNSEEPFQHPLFAYPITTTQRP